MTRAQLQELQKPFENWQSDYNCCASHIFGDSYQRHMLPQHFVKIQCEPGFQRVSLLLNLFRQVADTTLLFTMDSCKHLCCFGRNHLCLEQALLIVAYLHEHAEFRYSLSICRRSDRYHQVTTYYAQHVSNRRKRR